MKPKIVVRVRFLPGIPVPQMLKVVGLAKLPTDEPGHPYGQWSVVLDLWSEPDHTGSTMAWFSFAFENAPMTAVVPKATFIVSMGPKPVAEVEVQTQVVPKGAQPKHPTYENDFLSSRHTPTRAA